MIVNTKELKAELEKAGEKEVREKLAAGVYGAWKVNTIKEWLKEKEEERNGSNLQEQNDLTRKSIKWTKIGIVAGIIFLILGAIFSLI